LEEGADHHCRFDCIKCRGVAYDSSAAAALEFDSQACSDPLIVVRRSLDQKVDHGCNRRGGESGHVNHRRL